MEMPDRFQGVRATSLRCVSHLWSERLWSGSLVHTVVVMKFEHLGNDEGGECLEALRPPAHLMSI
jgi:hypothetical protein